MYFEVEPRYVPVTEEVPVMHPDKARELIDENTIGGHSRTADSGTYASSPKQFGMPANFWLLCLSSEYHWQLLLHCIA